MKTHFFIEKKHINKAKNGQKVKVKSSDRFLVGQFCSEIRALRLPEPYKGKGIRYSNERIRRKEGKKAA